MPIRVFHCDDSQPFTRLAWFWLSGCEDIAHVGAAHSVEEALATIAAAAPDVILLDTMGSPDDTALLDAIRSLVPSARVIVYSGYVNIMRLAGGADAYLAKDDDEAELLAAIRRVAAS
jgi:DNA-binding NarL/FixJ family response regulator